MIRPQGEPVDGRPRLIVVDEVLELPGGIPYVVSFVELWSWGTVVRFVGLAAGFVAQMPRLDLGLRDDGGHWHGVVAVTSGGMVLPEEVTVSFADALEASVSRVEVVEQTSGQVFASAKIAGGEGNALALPLLAEQLAEAEAAAKHGRRVIRVFPDWGNRWPLWESGDANSPTPTPTDLALSDELTGTIAKWYDYWAEHFHWERGWDSVENEDIAWATGSEFIERLREEVADFADVEDERQR